MFRGLSGIILSTTLLIATAEAQQATPAANSAQAVTATTSPAEVPVSPPPKKLAVGTEGLFQPGILLQGWYLVDRADQTTSTFRLRRAEIAAKGEIIPKLVSYAISIDPARTLEFQDKTLTVANQTPAATDSSKPESVTAKQPVGATTILKDVLITFQTVYADITLGQFKLPVSWEGSNSSSKLLFAELAPVSQAFGDKRDIGLKVAKSFKYIGYSANLLNGAGQNNLDTNNSKDAALRLELYPIDGLTLAGVIYGSIGQRHDPNSKDRYEGDIRFEKGPFLLQAEYISARDVGADRKAIRAHGVYGALAYRIIDVIQPCVRVGYLDPNTKKNLDPAKDKGKDEFWHLDLGLNWYIAANEAKLQLNYYRFQYQDKTADNQAILAAQVAY
jgi:phosphate-selective porin